MRRLLLTTTVTACVLLAAPGSASALTCNFAGPGVWHSAANWSCLQIPTTGDTAVVGSGDLVTVDQAASVGGLNLDGLGQIAFANDPTITVAGALSATSGWLNGTGTVSVVATGSFSKTTSSFFYVENGADLLLDANASLSADAS